MSVQSEVNKMVRDLRHAGLIVEPHKKSWGIRRPGDKAPVVTMALSPSDHRWRRNTISALRRAGIDFPSKGGNGKHKPAAAETPEPRQQPVATEAVAAPLPPPPKAAAAKTEMYSEVVTVTPELAEEWLKRNLFNRKLRDDAIDGYMRDLQNGKVIGGAGSIKFSSEGVIDMKGETTRVPEGTLLDGQHRLMACALAGIPFVSVVVYGVSPEAIDVIDTGKPRSAADALTIHGVTKAFGLAAAARVLFLYEKGEIGAVARRKAAPTHVEVREIIAKNPELADSVKVGQRSKGRFKIMPPATAAALHYIFSRKDREKAERFFDILFSDDSVHHPAYTLRKRLLTNMVAPKQRRLAPRTVVALTIRAWNAARAGQVGGTRILAWQPDEAFPEVK